MEAKFALYPLAEWQSRSPQLHPNVFGSLDSIGYSSTKDATG